VYFPREIIPFSTVFVALVDFAVGSVLLVALMAYRDVKYLFEIGAALRVNPMTPIIDAYRDVLLRGELPEVVPFAAAAVVAVVALGIAWTSFHAAEGSFAENV
jgi:ABC-type polysaccharide/polyol phosphate export permease